MERSLKLVIPAGIKLEDAPELYAAFIQQIEEFGIAGHLGYEQAYLDVFVRAAQKLEAASGAARDLVRMYWDEPGNRYEAPAKLRTWFENRPKLDPFEEATFAMFLIEIAGRRALKEGVYKRASDAARSKNAKPREWVKAEWEGRSDKGQSKAAFARQYAPLVKRRFDVPVTPETIARDWLPKG